MKRAIALGAVLVSLVAGPAIASPDDTEALIQLDKEWGSAVQGQEAVDVINRIIADDVVAMSPDGVGTKADMIEDASQAAEGEAVPYMADHFDVRFLSDDVAVMVHHANDPDHWSLHVWQKKDGAWQVVASATAPVDDDDDD